MSNLNMLNAMVIIIFSVLDWKYPFTFRANLVQKIKLFTLKFVTQSNLSMLNTIEC